MNSTTKLRAFGWDGYRILLAVADTGTLSAAAKQLGLSQPTVGRRVAALEADLGVRLFERSPEGLRSTSAALRVLPDLRRVAEQASSIEATLRGHDESLDQPIRIATTIALGSLDLTARIAKLRKLHPDLGLELHYGLELVDLLRGEADVVLRHSSPGSPEFVGRKVARSEVGLWASPAYLDRAGTPRRRSELRGHDRIEATGPLERLPGSAWLRSAGREGEARIACSDLVGVAALVRAGCGVGVLPRYVAEKAPMLRRLLPRQASWQADLWLLTRRELRKARRVRVVLDYLAESYRGARL